MCRRSLICNGFGEGERNISINPTPGVMYKIQLHLFNNLSWSFFCLFLDFSSLISSPCPWPEVPFASPGSRCLALPLPRLQQCSSPLHQPPLPLPSPLPPTELLYLRSCSPVSGRTLTSSAHAALGSPRKSIHSKALNGQRYSKANQCLG